MINIVVVLSSDRIGRCINVVTENTTEFVMNERYVYTADMITWHFAKWLCRPDQLNSNTKERRKIITII